MEKITLPLQRLDAKFSASRADRANRTVPVVFYTGAKVVQFSFAKGLHELQMSMEPSAIRLESLRSGRAPFTMGHAGPNAPGAVLGVISEPRIENGSAIANVRFSKRPDVEPIYQDVLDGILGNVSMEAALHKLKETTKEGASMRSFLATDWEPVAIALVSLGADGGAQITASSQEPRECLVELSRHSGHVPGAAGLALRRREIEIAKLRYL
jgi:hypothetical protein